MVSIKVDVGWDVTMLCRSTRRAVDRRSVHGPQSDEGDDVWRSGVDGRMGQSEGEEYLCGPDHRAVECRMEDINQ
jgi:hypothetical protein